MLLSRLRLTARRLVGVVLLAMLLGQWAVQAHSIGHAPAQDVVGHELGRDHAHDHAHDHGWGHQAGTSACDLVDHLLTGQAPASAPVLNLWLPPETTHDAARAASHAPRPVARAYEARGPPWA